MRIRIGVTALCLTACLLAAASAQDDQSTLEMLEDLEIELSDKLAEELADELPWELPEGELTLSGTQFCQDIQHFHGWRIQQNVLTQHYRLLDENDRRHALGTLEHCREELDRIAEAEELPAMSGTAVIVLHGLGGWPGRMRPLCDYLAEEGGFTVINVSYPSTRGNLAAHAAALAGIIDHLDGIEKIHFVAHSMGNLVIRRYLADTTDPDNGRQGDGRIGRFVMSAPPNHGAVIAERFADHAWYPRVLGTAAAELAPDQWPATEQQLATPACPFGIIAGNVVPSAGGNPLIEGEDDMLVAVEETRLVGADDYVELALTHNEIDCDATVCEYTLRFLQEGYFISPELRSPIEAEVEDEELISP